MSVDTFFMENRSSDFRTYLQEELALRCRRNSAYSLRSFAKSLDVSPSFLSKILNGQRRVTASTFEKITTYLKLDARVIKSFQKNGKVARLADNYHHLQLEYFKIISDWYHYALLELTYVKGFKNSPEWIASKLGISINQAKSAMERLINLNLLELKDGKLCPTSGGNTTTKNEFTDFAFKKMQDELLKKAVHSLWNEDLGRRDHTSICMAIHPDDIPEVKKRLAKMRREICEYLERPQQKTRTQVYNLSLSFFSLSKESL